MTHHPPLIVGVLGHHGHGKSTLAVALLRRLVRQGVLVTPSPTHDRGVVENHPHPYWYCCSADSTTLLVDCPRPSNDWLAAVLPTLDGAVVVVDADRGIEPQTRDLIVLARQAGVASLAGFLTHADLATESRVDEVELALRRLMHALELPGDDVPVLRGNASAALLGDGFDESSGVLDRLLAALRTGMHPRVGESDAPLLLPVGRGWTQLWTEGGWTPTRLPPGQQRCRLFGRVSQGAVGLGDLVELVTPRSATTLRVEELTCFGQQLPTAGAGDAVGVVLTATKKSGRDDLPQTGTGCVVAAPGTVRFRRRFRARLELYSRAESRQSVGNGTTCNFLLGSAGVHGTLDLTGRPKNARLGADEPAVVAVTLHHGCMVAPGQSFAMRHKTGVLAAGTVLEILDDPPANP